MLKNKSGYPLERHKDYTPKPSESLTEMFNNKELRSNSNFKLLLFTQVTNLAVIITPINWVTKLDWEYTPNQRPWFKMTSSTLPYVRAFQQSDDNRTQIIYFDPVKVTQLTNVTTQYGMTTTQNSYMWMCGFAGEGQGSTMEIFYASSRWFRILWLQVGTRSKP